MNYLKKIDHYLLVNYPILWRTKVHYFVLFSLILGNVATFGLGYFLIKWFGAINTNVICMVVRCLMIFVILIWSVSQARNKIRYYNFWDEVLTFSIYVLCTMFLFGNSILFDRTLIHTKANLVSVEQIDIDRELIRDKREIDRKSHGLSRLTRSYPPQDVVDVMAKRYKIDRSYKYAEISVKVNEISKKTNLIYHSQLDLKMRPPEIMLPCGVGESSSSMRYVPFIFIMLLIPVLLFLISHTRLFTVFSIAAIFFFVITFGSMLMGVAAGSAVYMFLYLMLGLAVIYGMGQTYRFAILLIIPYILIVAFCSAVFLSNYYIYIYNETYQLIFSILFTSLITIFSGAYFIKRYFEPTT